MTARELLASLEASDVRLSIQGERLVLDAPKGVLSAVRIEEIRPYKPALLAIVAERQVVQSSSQPTRDSFDDIVEDARRFQREGKPGPWEAFTMSVDALEGAISGLQPGLQEEFDLRIGIYRREGLPEEQGCRIALFLLAGEHGIPLDGT